MFTTAFSGSMLTYLFDFAPDHSTIVAFATTSRLNLVLCKANVRLKNAHRIERLSDAFAAGWTFGALTIHTGTMLRKVTNEIKRTLRVLSVYNVTDQHTLRRVTTEYRHLRRLHLRVDCEAPPLLDLRPLVKLAKFSARFETEACPVQLAFGPSLTSLSLDCNVLPEFEAEELTSLSLSHMHVVGFLPSLPNLTAFTATFVDNIAMLLPALPPGLKTLVLHNKDDEITDFRFLSRHPSLEQFNFMIERHSNGLEIDKLGLWELPLTLTSVRLDFWTRFPAERDLSWLGRLEGLVVASIGLHAMKERQTILSVSDPAKCTKLQILDVFDVCNYSDCVQQLRATHPRKIWPSLSKIDFTDRERMFHWDLKDELKKATMYNAGSHSLKFLAACCNNNGSISSLAAKTSRFFFEEKFLVQTAEILSVDGSEQKFSRSPLQVRKSRLHNAGPICFLANLDVHHGTDRKTRRRLGTPKKNKLALRYAIRAFGPDLFKKANFFAKKQNSSTFVLYC